MKYFLAIMWLITGSCAFAGADSTSTPLDAGRAWRINTSNWPRGIPIQRRLPCPPLVLANQDPETVKYAHALRMLWFRDVAVADASVETALAAFSQAVAETFPKKPKLRFVMQTEGRGYLNFSFSSVPLTTALEMVSTLAEVDFVVDRDTIIVKPKAKPSTRSHAASTAPAQ